MIHNQSKKGYFVTIISWFELVENLNKDFSMGQYDSMRMILRKLFQKMLNYILWLYFETCKVIMAIIIPSAPKKKNCFYCMYHEYFVGFKHTHT